MRYYPIFYVSFLESILLYSYNHKIHQHLPKLTALLSGLTNKIASPKVVIISTLLGSHDQPNRTRETWESGWLAWEDFVKEGQQHKLGRSENGEIEWYRAPFDWPLWILFSSGTTGRPKYVCSHAAI